MSGLSLEIRLVERIKCDGKLGLHDCSLALLFSLLVEQSLDYQRPLSNYYFPNASGYYFLWVIIKK